jgi:hypothetical protein
MSAVILSFGRAQQMLAARHYRSRAKEFHAVAKSLHNPALRGDVFEMARAYNALAALLEADF